jgi:hypothetical protein
MDLRTNEPSDKWTFGLTPRNRINKNIHMRSFTCFQLLVYPSVGDIRRPNYGWHPNEPKYLTMKMAIVRLWKCHTKLLYMLGGNAIRRKSIYMVFIILLYINDIWSLDRLNRNGVSSEHISKEEQVRYLILMLLKEYIS